VHALTSSYRVLKFNRRAGMVEQDIDHKVYGVPVITPDVSAEEFRGAWRKIPFKHRLLLWLMLPIVVIGRLFGGTRAIWAMAMEETDETESPIDDVPEMAEAFCGERDRRLLAALHDVYESRGSGSVEVAVV